MQGKEYLYIVTDYMPFTICDLNISPSYYTKFDMNMMAAQKNQQDMSLAKKQCLESIK